MVRAGGAGDGASVVEEDEAGRGGEIGCGRGREWRGGLMFKRRLGAEQHHKRGK